MTKFQFLVPSFHSSCCLDLCSSTMIQMDGGDRLRVTLLDCISTVETRRSLTLEAVLRADKGAPPPPPPLPPTMTSSPATTHLNRTLLDVMRSDNHRNVHQDKTAWKSLREKLLLKRNAPVWTSPNPVTTLDIPIPDEDSVIPDNSDGSSSNRFNRLGYLLSSNSEVQTLHSQTDQTDNNRSNHAHVSDDGGGSAAVEREGRLRLGAALAEERALSARETVSTTTSEPQTEVLQPPRMSLMELLEENEGEIGVMYGIDDEDVFEEEERDGGAAAEIGCCVCMIRSKGAAFIPCGHTFCRLCSRELWVQRGNCPLCNASISEILDIF